MYVCECIDCFYFLFIYFSTVWYELLCGEWPFHGQPPESIIWQVGKGVKQTLANIQASRDVKVCCYDFFTAKICNISEIFLLQIIW